MRQWIAYFLFFLLSGSGSVRLQYNAAEFPDDPYYDQSCSNVPWCHCYLTGEDYQADCADPDLLWIPQRLSYNITVLYVSGTQLQTLTSESLVRYPYLRVIHLDSNTLTAIEPGCLDILEDLEIFSVRDNLLDTLPHEIFQRNIRLTQFDGSHNKLSELPVLKNLNNLKEIDLSFNAISTIVDSPFDGCAALRTINLAFNQIASLPDSLLSGALGVEDLDLSSNRISHFSAATFSNLNSLKTLLLRNNSLDSLSAGSFASAVALHNLDLGNNSLTTIDPDAFQGLSSLSVLQLDFNRFESVPSSAFGPLTAIRTLYLGGNRLVSIPTAAFVGIPALRELFLDGMAALGSVQPNAFRDLGDLERLSLANNPSLVELPADSVPASDLPKLASIYLNGDGFVHLDEGLFTDKPELQLVDLFNNPFNCSCHLKWMPRVVMNEVIWASHWSTSSTPPECYYPNHLRGWSIPTMLETDMTCDELEMVPVSPEYQITHLRNTANISVYLFKGLPSSVWLTPDDKLLIPFPAGEHPLNMRRYASWTLIENNTIESTLFLKNASVTDDHGEYRIHATNIAGNKTMAFHIEVLPFELTTTTPVWQTSELIVDLATKQIYSALSLTTSLLFFTMTYR